MPCASCGPRAPIPEAPPVDVPQWDEDAGRWRCALCGEFVPDDQVDSPHPTLP